MSNRPAGVTMVATDPAELPAVTDLIHDCWFEKDAIRFDEQSATLTIPFVRPSLDDPRVLLEVTPVVASVTTKTSFRVS